MIVVIIAGGSGTRLWPLSIPSRPKHLLKLDKDDKSLLQRTYERALSLTDKVYVASEASHIDDVKRQLPELPETAFVIEPARRGTANCILAALIQISKANPSDESVVFMHADHYIRDTEAFAHTFKLAVKTSEKHNRIVLIGIEPDRPATGFGYIQKGELIDEQSYVFNVSSFKEKPDYETATQFVNSGEYLWNAGYFVGSAELFKRAMEEHAADLYKSYTKLETASPESFHDEYLSLTANSIDYALIEKIPDLLVIPASFDWMDIGSFEDMHKAVGGDDQGNYVLGNVIAEDVQNSLIQNHEEKPLAVIGLDNIVVINSPNGILVVRKDLSQKVGDVSKRFEQENS